jgi:hypothetical protein
VYLEKNNPKPDDLVYYHLSQPFYDPPYPMEYNTCYYWKIVAWDPDDANTTGPIWDFTTSIRPNNPPNTPSNPSPKNGTTDVNVDINLNWNCSDPDDDDLIYDVYFKANDTTPDVLVSDDQIETVYDPGILQPETTYYWQIIAKDEYGASTTGPIWHFTTKKSQNDPPGAPIINGPKSGKPGNTYSYTFVAIDLDGDDIFYEIDWGDGNVYPWDGPYESNTIITKDHVWEEKGTYTIRTRAKDEYDAIGDWSEFAVRMPRNKVINTPFINLLEEYPNLFPILQKLLIRLTVY